MKKLWSSDNDTDEEEVVEESPFKNDDPPRLTDHVHYITCFTLFNFAQFTSYCGRFISISAAFCTIFMLVKIHLNLRLRPPLISDQLSKIPKVLTVSKLSYVCRTSLNAGYNDFLIIAFFSVYLWILNLFQ